MTSQTDDGIKLHKGYGDLWRVTWSDGEHVIDNVFAAAREPELRLSVSEDGLPVILDQDDVEVARVGKDPD